MINPVPGGQQPNDLGVDSILAPSPQADWVGLARSKQGRLFRKHILTKGPLRHPLTGKQIDIDDAFVAAMRANFEAGVCDIVQVPLANDSNEHVEDPARNLGEVIGLEEDGEKVYAVIDVRRPDAADSMGKTLLGASAMMHLDYTDARNGEKVGPTLLHVAVTNRPYVTGLDDYEEVLAASADSSGDVAVMTPVMAPMEESRMDLDQLLDTLRDEHGIDVRALQAQADEVTEIDPDEDGGEALAQAVLSALQGAGIVKLAKTEELSADDVVSAVAELATNHVALTDKVGALVRDAAAREVHDLVESGRVLPVQEAAMLELRLSNKDMFDKIVPADPIVRLSNEQGVGGDDSPRKELDIDAEIDRLVGSLPTRK